uniref:hypothetical protein n=1 Tax=uncultured Dysosmobacter sp. TaxID=2591384 RepID=UPI002623BBB2
TRLGLYGNLSLSAKQPLTRDNVAVMVFNALTQCVPVQYNELLGIYYNEQQGITYNQQFNYLQTLGYKNFDLVYKTDTQDIYGRPAKTWGTGSYATTTSAASTQKNNNLDEDGNLINQFVRMLDKDEIITVPLTPDRTYTKSVKERDVAKDLGKSVCTTSGPQGYDWTVYINGKEEEAAPTMPETDDTNEWVYTGEGVQTEIYIDDADQTVRVVEINYYLGQITRVRDTEDGEEVTVKPISRGAELDVKTFLAEGYSEDDYVIFTEDYDEDDDDYIIGELFVPETVTVTVDRVEFDTDFGHTYLRTSDGKYIYSETEAANVPAKEPERQQHMVYDLDEPYGDEHPALNEDYVLYLDPTGYVVAFQEAGDQVVQYLYVQDADEHLGTWEAKVVLADGTSQKVELASKVKGDKTVKADGDSSDTDNGTIRWGNDSIQHANNKNNVANIVDHVYSYTVNSSGVYTLTDVVDVPFGTQRTDGVADTAKIHNGKAYIDEFLKPNTAEIGNDIIVDRQTSFVIVDEKTAYTGYTEVPDVDNAGGYYVAKSATNKVAAAVFVLDGDLYSGSGRYFVLSNAHWESKKIGGTTYRIYDKGAYENGEKIGELWVAEDAYDGELEAGVLYKILKTEKDTDYVIDLERYVDVAPTPDYSKAIVAGEYIDSGDNAFRIRDDGIAQRTVKFDTNEDTVYVTVEIDADGKITVGPGSIKDAMYRDTEEKAEYTKTVFVVKASNDSNTADLVYIFVQENAGASSSKGKNGGLTWDVEKIGDHAFVNWTYTAPEYAGVNQDVTYTVVVKANGTVIHKESPKTFKPTVANKGTDVAGEWDGRIYDSNATVTVEVTDVKLTYIGIRYVDGDTSEVLADNTWKNFKAGTAFTTNTRGVIPTNGSNIEFKLVSDDSVTRPSYTVTGLAKGDVTIPTELSAAANGQQTINADANKPMGDRVVIVTIYGLSSLNEAYEVKVNETNISKENAKKAITSKSPDNASAAAAALSEFDASLTAYSDDTLKIEFNTVENIKRGDSVKMTVTMNAINKAAAYDVTVTVNGADKVFHLTMDKATDSVVFDNVKSDLSVDNVKIKPVTERLAIEPVSKSNAIIAADGKSMTIVFNQPVASKDGEDLDDTDIVLTDTGNAFIKTITVRGKKIELTFSQALANNATVKVVAASVMGSEIKKNVLDGNDRIKVTFSDPDFSAALESSGD